MFRSLSTLVPATLVAFAALLPLRLTAQITRPPRITGRIDESVLRTLAGNTRPEANFRNDRGLVSDDLVMDHMLLQLERSPEQENAVHALIDDLHNPDSPKYHQWLTVEEYGSYAPAPEDVEKVTAWLESRGFTVNTVYQSGMVIDFSGTAAQVREAFHTPIHSYLVNGVVHVANSADPQIPAALAPVVTGVVSMHDFRPHSMKLAHRNFTFTSGGFPYQALVPADLATIYDLNPLFAKGLTGLGQTIAVVEDTNLYSAADWNTFRSKFGLTAYAHGSLVTVHPAPSTGRNNCGNPGVNGDDGEAILDAEWASAAAPDATIAVEACADTRSTFGGLIAIQNLINSKNPPSIMSISYGECEAENGAASNKAFNTAYQQAAAEGISVFVAAGDEGSASCDAGAPGATHGIGVSAFASTPYNVAVGGTDFADSYLGTNASYWNATNSPTYGSALSYIPETPWNDSCAGGLISNLLGFTTTFGANSFCATSTANQQGFLAVAGGSGGPSGCATGNPTRFGVVGGSCKGYAKPSWQAGVPGIPADGVRDIPDVSLFAANGLWGHYYVFCWSDGANGGAPCTGDPSTWAGAGGTSFSSPIMAGIQALVNQHQGAAQGNPNYVYYKLAASEYAGNGLSTCNSSSASSSSCTFHDVTLGDNVVNCSGSFNCYGYAVPKGHPRLGTPDGALSVSTTSFQPAYGTGAGWDFSSGIGSVDAYKLVMGWSPQSPALTSKK
jgi:subtilase family serine protease